MSTGLSYRCPGCGYVYDERKGEPHEGFAPGTPWRDVPEDWDCPNCAVRQKPDFVEQQRASGDGSSGT